MTLNKQDLKLLRYWLNHKLRPFVRIEAKVKHLNTEYTKTKEILKTFRDGNLSLIHEKLSISEIMNSNLPMEDKLELLKNFQHSFYNQLQAVS